MPRNIQKFEVNGESFIFALKGMPEIRLILGEKTEFSRVNFVLDTASHNRPFDWEFSGHLV